MNVEPHTDREKILAASCASAVASSAGSTAWEAAFVSMKNEFKIGDRVSGYGILASVQGTVVGISEDPLAVEVKWDNAALVAPGRAGRWEELYDVQKVEKEQ